MKILMWDVETAPSMAYVWKIWKENIGTSQLLDVGRVICWSAKWMGDEEVLYSAEWIAKPKEMVTRLHELLEEADAHITYNGNRFDTPVIQSEFLKYGLAPPAPSKSIDLYQVVKRQFRFISNRMDFVCQQLGLDGKTETGGFQLWSDVLEGDPEAQEKMIDYNIQDVICLEELYEKLKPWIPNHPNSALYAGPANGERVCPTCGSTHVQRRGTAKTSTMVYRRYQCMDCKSWSRERLADKELQTKPDLVRDNTK